LAGRLYDALFKIIPLSDSAELKAYNIRIAELQIYDIQERRRKYMDP
jgi:hypothetical protein